VSRPQRLREVFKRSPSALGPATSFHETAALPKFDGKGGGCQGKTARSQQLPSPSTAVLSLSTTLSYLSSRPKRRGGICGAPSGCPSIYPLDYFPFVIPTRIPPRERKQRKGLRPILFNPCSAPATPVQTWGTRPGGQDGAESSASGFRPGVTSKESSPQNR
jgi:hypothetical protein